MKISPFFHDLRSAYQAEIDDLTQDSEGKDVLRKRLARKRSEIGFLVKMMEVAPEMVAVVFTKVFASPALLRWNRRWLWVQDHLPSWESLSTCISLEPWAAALAKTVLAEPGGDRFMVIAAGLEYLQQARFAGSAVGGEADAEGDEDDADDREHDDDYDALSADDVVEPHDSRSREEASANWLADVGFERKD